MPPVKFHGWCGERMFLCSADDVIIAAPWWILTSLVVILADTETAVRVVVAQAKFMPFWALQVDLWMNVASIPMDLLLMLIAKFGALGKKRTFPKTLSLFLFLRALLALAIFAMFNIAVLGSLKTYGHRIWVNINDLHDEPFAPVDPAEIGGWGPDFGPLWRNAFLWVALIFRGVIYIGLMLSLWLAFVPRNLYGYSIEGAMQASLNLMGVPNSMFSELVQLMTQVFDVSMLDYVTPSDFLFGLLVWQHSQGQGILATDPDAEPVFAVRDSDKFTLGLADEEDEDGPLNCGVSPSVLHASMLTGNGQGQKPPQPFQPSDAKDIATLQEVCHLLPFALGIYGWQFQILMGAVMPGTTLPIPGRLFRALCSLPFCGSPSEGPQGFQLGERTEDDWGCHANERALLRMLDEAAEQSGEETPELLWATWKNNGAGTSPPLGVFLDFAKQQVVVAVRGTMDAKDVIADVGAEPEFFDPLKEAPPSARRKAPFDNDRDYFVHGGMHLCAIDSLSRLKARGILEEVLAPGGRASGWRVVCCGHSLGAGVSCILAFLLKEAYPTWPVHYMGFEPPGGLVSTILSNSAKRLGWVSCVCANDWIARLSIRGAQLTRERVLDAIVDCEHSKYGIAMLFVSGAIRNSMFLCCFRRPLAALFQCLGGGPLKVSRSWSISEKSKLRSAIAKDHDSHPLFPILWPAGDVAYFRPVAMDTRCCGWYNNDTHWVAEWIQPSMLSEIIVSAKSVEYHFPNILKYAYSQAAFALGAIEEEPCY